MCIIKRETNKSYKVKADGDECQRNQENIHKTIELQMPQESDFRVHIEDSHETSKAVE